MTSTSTCASRLALSLTLVAAATAGAQEPSDVARLGGGGTVVDTTANAFGLPSPLLTAEQRRAFAVGNALFRSNWIAAPASAQGLDGLGPLFNARSCSSCHLHDGRSRPPNDDDVDRQGLLVRIGRRRATAADEPHPDYGDQIQDRAIPGARPEARVELHWTATAGSYADGSAFELLAPQYELRDLAYGALGDEVVLGGRVAPQLIGLGLLEAIPAAAVVAAADPDDRDGDGVSGRAHVLAHAGGQLGRFGWKATQPSVHAQTAAAFVHDMGITSSEHPDEPLGAGERALAGLPNGGRPEIDDHKLGRVVFYARTLAVPAQRDAGSPDVIAGRERFTAFGCAGCHVPQWTTGAEACEPAFANQVIHPFTDLLLHDLGPGLADKHDGDALPGEWRTPPLWGAGLVPVVDSHDRYLHDGRARGFAEAVLWHGGEAEAARERFRTAPRAQREQLLAFLRSL